jgi:hypothetical protein
MNRPTYEVPASTPKFLADIMLAAAKRKAIWVNPNGTAFWINELAQAEAMQAKNGGTVFAPEVIA